jgi:hypothetical protein
MSDANQYQVVSSPNYSGPAAALASIFGLNKQQQPQQPQQAGGAGGQQQQGSFISQLMQFLQGNGGGMAGGSPMQLGPGSSGSMSGGIGGGGQLLY